MADISECPVCFEDFTEPKLLPCNHTLCLKCLGNLEKNRTITCPLCNAVHEVPERGVQAFTENQHAAQLAAVIRKKFKEMETRMAKTNKAKPEKAIQDEGARASTKSSGSLPTSMAELVDCVSASSVSDNVGDVGPSVRPKTIQNKVRTEKSPVVRPKETQQSQMLTELNAIRSEYNQNACSCCGKTGEELDTDSEGGAGLKRLKACTRCKTAMYCSRQCQTKDWNMRHKDDCQNIKRLTEAIGKEEESTRNVIRPDQEQPQQTSTNRANLLTFCRQKLAMIQSQYNQRHCSHCGKSDREVEMAGGSLKSCTQCKTAQYCSRQCQADDWKLRHKADCREITRLREIIQKEAATMTRRLKATLCGKPWSVTVDKCIPMLNLFCNGEKQLMQYTSEGFMVTAIHNVTSGKEECVVCKKDAGNANFGAGVVQTGTETYIIVASPHLGSNLYQIEFWKYPITSPKPVYTFKHINDAVTSFYSATFAHDDKIYVSSEMDKTIHEYSAATFPITRTGLTVPTGINVWNSYVQQMRLVNDGNNQNIIILYAIRNFSSPDLLWVKRIDMQGKELWNLMQEKDLLLDGERIHPISVCVDDSGHVFMCDRDKPRVAVLHGDLTLQTLLTTTGNALGVAWCSSRRLLVVTHVDLTGTRMVSVPFTVGVEGETGVTCIHPQGQVADAGAQRKQKFQLSVAATFNLPCVKQLLGMCSNRGSLFIYCCAYNHVLYFDANGKQRGVMRMKQGQIVRGLCAFSIGDSAYVAVSLIALRPTDMGRIEIWPVGGSRPVHTYPASRPHQLDRLQAFEGRLYVSNDSPEVQEFDLKSVAMKPTGLTIPVRLYIERMWLYRQQGDKSLMYTTGAYLLSNEWALECVNFRGELLWRLDNSAPTDAGLNGMEFAEVCADEEGNVFAVDVGNNRVVVIHEDLTPETLFQSKEVICAFSRCDVTQRLYVIYRVGDVTDPTFFAKALSVTHKNP